MGKRKIAWVALMLLLAPACAGSKRTTAGPVSYKNSAHANYKKGMRELRDENYPEAIKYFHFVKNKFPFSRFATLAELRIADTYFAQEKHVAAIDAYKLFVKFHPTHPKVLDGYAAYRICQGYVLQIPGDWFLVPPSHEKDQSATREAVRELTIFLRSHEKSKHVPAVRKLYRKTVRRLADHELYVAKFYLERDKPKATILRLEGVLRRFPDAGVHPEVMLLLGKTYLKLDERAKARTTFLALVKKYPNDQHSSKAKLYLKYLSDTASSRRN